MFLRRIESAIRRYDRRVLLGGAIALLFGAWCFGVVVREPYPAPVFPRFGSIPEDEEIEPVRIRLLAFESGAERETVTAAELFDGPFDSFHPQMLDSLMRATPDDHPRQSEFALWVQDRAAEEFGWDCAEAFELIEVVPDGSEPEKSLNRFEFGTCA
ncbi:MAG: hypothetical protein ACR2QK_04370 [Acidimicrobiales bacterium]